MLNRYAKKAKLSFYMLVHFERNIDKCSAEFYLYPTVSRALIYLLISQNRISETRSNTVYVQTELYLACMVIIARRIVTHKIFINKKLKHANVTIRLACILMLQFNLI